MKTLIGCILLSVTTVILAEFPASITRCQAGDSDCFARSTQEVLSTKWKGLREFNLLPFNPLRIKSLILEKNPSSPVNIQLKFNDLDVYGFKDAKVLKATGLNFKERSVLEAVVPQLILKGKYIADGRVLILPIVGNGFCEIICTNIKLHYSFDLKPLQKNGNTFAELEHVKLDIKPEHVHFQLDNLFNGDKALGDNMNVFINENWQDIFHEMEPGFAKALGLVAKQMFNNVFAKFQFDEYFV